MTTTPNNALNNDTRARRARALTRGLAKARVQERRRLILELRADGHPMAAIAKAIGVSRTRAYAIAYGAGGTEGVDR